MKNFLKGLLWWKKWPVEKNTIYTFKSAAKLVLNTDKTNHIDVDITNLPPWIAKVMLDKLKEDLCDGGRYEVILSGKVK
jgi:hypothetical protein